MARQRNRNTTPSLIQPPIPTGVNPIASGPSAPLPTGFSGPLAPPIIFSPSSAPTSTPLPTPAGGNAVPPVTAPPTTPLGSTHSSSAQSENWQRGWSEDMNRAEREATLARNIKAEEDAKAGFTSLLGMANESNSNPSVRTLGTMSSASSLPFIPKFTPPTKEQIPDMKLGQFSDAYSYDRRQSQGGRGTGAEPQQPLVSDIPLLFRTPNGGLGMRFDAYDSPSAIRFTNDPTEIKWFGMDDAKNTRNAFNSKLYANGGDDIGDWKTSSLRGLRPGSRSVVVNNVHDSFDNVVRGTALTYMIENGGRNYIRIRDGRGWRPLRANEEYGNLSNRDMRIDMSSVVRERTDPATGQTVSEIRDTQAYNTLMAGIEKAYVDNGWRGGEKPTGQLYNKIHSDIKNNAFRERNADTIAGVLREQAVRKSLLHIFGYND